MTEKLCGLLDLSDWSSKAMRSTCIKTITSMALVRTDYGLIPPMTCVRRRETLIGSICFWRGRSARRKQVTWGFSAEAFRKLRDMGFAGRGMERNNITREG